MGGGGGGGGGGGEKPMTMSNRVAAITGNLKRAGLEGILYATYSQCMQIEVAIKLMWDIKV